MRAYKSYTSYSERARGSAGEMERQRRGFGRHGRAVDQGHLQPTGNRRRRDGRSQRGGAAREAHGAAPQVAGQRRRRPLRRLRARCLRRTADRRPAHQNQRNPLILLLMMMILELI